MRVTVGLAFEAAEPNPAGAGILRANETV